MTWFKYFNQRQRLSQNFSSSQKSTLSMQDLCEPTHTGGDNWNLILRKNQACLGIGFCKQKQHQNQYICMGGRLRPSEAAYNNFKVKSDMVKRKNFLNQELTGYVTKSLLHSQSGFVCADIANKTKLAGIYHGLQLNFNPSGLHTKPLRSYLSELLYGFKTSRRFNRRHCSLVRIRNRCILTGHHMTHARLGLSRQMFRRLAGRGAMAGLQNH